MREYVRDSGELLNEMRLGNDEPGGEVHTYCPAYTPDTIGKFLAGSTHLTFNSLSQWEWFRRMWRSIAPRIPTSVSAPD